MYFKQRYSNEASKIKGGESNKSQIPSDRRGSFDPRRAALKEYEAKFSQDKAQQNDVRSSSDASKYIEILENFTYIGGNTELEKAQIIFLGGMHELQHHKALIFDFVNAHINDSGIILVEGVQAGKELDRFEYVHNNIIKVLNKKHRVYGWDDIKSQTKQFEIGSKIFELRDILSKTQAKDVPIEVEILYNYYDKLTFQRHKRMLQIIDVITNLFPDERIFVIVERYHFKSDIIQEDMKYKPYAILSANLEIPVNFQDLYVNTELTKAQFKDLAAKLREATNFISRHNKEFQKIGYQFEKFAKIQKKVALFQNKYEKLYNEYHNIQYKIDGDEKALFKKYCNSILKMHEDLKYFLASKHDFEIREDLDRKGRIEKLLKILPKERPTLSDLPRGQWWKLYIDVSMHEEAQKLNDPGSFFDQDQSPGYQQSMINLFEKVLVPAKNGNQKCINYNDYNKLHEIATRYIDNNIENVMNKPSGIGENGNRFGHYGLEPIEGLEIQERLKALKEMGAEYINGLPLFQNWQSLEEDFLEQITQKIAQSPPQAITIGWVRHDYTQTQLYNPSYGAKPGLTIMLPAYREEEGPRHVNTILESYYQGRERPNQSEYQRLREIAKTVRTLHVMHPKADGNGRTHIFGLMNKWLIEEGFTPAILPNGPEVFGGLKTLDGLVEDMLDGMHLFVEAVEQNRKMNWESVGKNC